VTPSVPRPYASIPALLTAGLLAVPVPAVARDAGSIAGTWARGDGGAVVRIARCGEAWCAENTWVAPERRARESVGDVLEMRVAPSGPKRLAGTAWDRRRDARYALTIDVSDDRLDTRGCVFVGLVCIDMSFTRVTGSAAR